MSEHECEKCGKKFTRKANYDAHMKRKTKCEQKEDKKEYRVGEEKHSEDADELSKEEKEHIRNKKKEAINDVIKGTKDIDKETVLDLYNITMVLYDMCTDMMKEMKEIREENRKIQIWLALGGGSQAGWMIYKDEIKNNRKEIDEKNKKEEDVDEDK